MDVGSQYFWLCTAGNIARTGPQLFAKAPWLVVSLSHLDVVIPVAEYEAPGAERLEGLSSPLL